MTFTMTIRTASEVQQREFAAVRAKMVCSPLQGQLALGEEKWAQVEAIANDPSTPFAMRRAIRSAGDWRRDSQQIDELGYLLGFTPEQMDKLFVAAMSVDI